LVHVNAGEPHSPLVIIQKPSLPKDELAERWQKPDYSTDELFVSIGYNRIFKNDK